MAITRWDPFAELRSLTHRLDSSLSSLGMPLTPFSSGYPQLGMPTFPATDVYEDKEEVVFRAELPGMEQKDVEVLIEDSTLTLRGTRKLYKEEKKENYQRVESSYGAFTRSFPLPSTVDRDKIRAEMRSGVLEVHVPKREGARGRSIPISG